jgi:hypothetical protein
LGGGFPGSASDGVIGLTPRDLASPLPDRRVLRRNAAARIEPGAQQRFPGIVLTVLSRSVAGHVVDNRRALVWVDAKL